MKEKLTTSEAEKLFEKMRGRIAKKLVGFETCGIYELDHDTSKTVRLSVEQFPVLELLPFALGLVQYRVVWNRVEKVRWTVYGSFEGNAFCIELRKMGPVFEFSPEIDEGKQKRIAGQLHCMLAAIHKDLKQLAMHQIAVGEVLIVNRYWEFNDRYEFFRKQTSEAYANNEFVADPNDNPLNQSLQAMMHDPKISRDGFYFTVAMVDVFFSRMEHLLLLHFAFLSRCTDEGDLARFITLPWKDRFKELVDIDRDEKSRKCWADLIQLKETIRNPFAHGGSENDGSSLMVQLPHVGPVPASLNGFKESPRASGWLPVEQGDFEKICLLCDQIDEMMRSGLLKHSFEMIEGGLDAAFDAKTRASYQEAIANPDELEGYIDGWNRRWMDYANFD